MIRFLHAADLHLDSPFAALTPQQAAIRRQEQRELLHTLSALCRHNDCDLLLLSGDLFDSGSVYRDTIEALQQALDACGAQVFIAPGNHDPISQTSPYLTEAWPSNVHIFTSEQIEAIRLDALGCTVYGAAFTAPTMPPMLQGFQAEDAPGQHLMVLHGDAISPASPYNPVTKQEIADSGLDYLALGHIHQCSDQLTAGETSYGWPGCPMGRGFDETGEKGVLLGQAEQGIVRVKFAPIAGRRYESLRVEAGTRPLERIRAALPVETKSHIYRIILTGESESVNLAALSNALDEQFYALSLVDETVPPVELWSRCGEDTLEGMSLHTLQQAMERSETPLQRRCIELAARRIAAVCEGREMPAL